MKTAILAILFTLFTLVLVHQLHATTGSGVSGPFTLDTTGLPGEMSLSGSITDAFNGKTIWQAIVGIVPVAGDTLWTTSSGDGSFGFTAIDPLVYPPGTWPIVVRHVGYEEFISTVVMTSGSHTGNVMVWMDTRTVVLVHGIFSNYDTAWNECPTNSFELFLQGNGRYVRGVNFGGSNDFAGWLSSMREIPVLARDMRSQLDRFVHSQGIHSYDVVAHSMGGLVSRHYIGASQDADGMTSVRRLITLGTPHHGSPFATRALQAIWVLASLFGGTLSGFEALQLAAEHVPAVYYLIPGNPYLNALNYGDQVIDDSDACGNHQPERYDQRTQYYSIAGTTPVGLYKLAAATFSWFCGSDGIVPVKSAKFWRFPGNSWLDTQLMGCLGSHHVPGQQVAACDLASPVVGLTKDPCIQNAVLDVLNGTDPTTTSPRHDPAGSPSSVQAAPMEFLPSITASLPPGGSYNDSTDVLALTEASFVCMWLGDSLSYTLSSPTGLTVDPAYASSSPAVEFVGGVKYAMYTIAAPEIGRWRHHVNALAAVETDSVLIVTGFDSDVTLNASEVDNIVPSGTFTLSAQLLDTGLPLANSAVSVAIGKPDATTDVTLLYDDASHGDPVAGDGDFHGSYAPAGLSGTYSFTFVARTDTTLADSEGRELARAASAELLPDLSVSQSEFTVSDITPVLGGTVNLSALIRNNALASADSIVITLSDYTHSSVLAESTVVALAPGAFAAVTGKWVAAWQDTTRLLVNVRVLGGQAEIDYANNSSDTLMIIGVPVPTGIADDGLPQGDPTPPPSYLLRNNAPNPFSGTTSFFIDMPDHLTGQVTELMIYNVAGKRVRRLASKRLRAGISRLVWDGRSDAGTPVSTGIYFVRLRVLRHTEVRKVAVIR